MHQRVWIVACVLPFLFSCTKKVDSSESVHTISPNLELKSIDDKCLDLQNAIAQMDVPGFVFPGYVYTRQFESLISDANTEYVNSQMVKSFRAEKISFKGLSDLRGLIQHGCEKVTISDFGGRTVTYTVSQYSKNHLEFELDKNALTSALSDMPKHHQLQLAKTPTVKKYVVKISSPTQIELVNIYTSVPSDCYKTAGLNYREELVYGWADNSAAVAQNAKIEKSYWAKLASLTAAPEIPAEILQNPEQNEFEVLNLEVNHPTIIALRSYAHPHCL